LWYFEAAGIQINTWPLQKYHAFCAAQLHWPSRSTVWPLSAVGRDNLTEFASICGANYPHCFVTRLASKGRNRILNRGYKVRRPRNRICINKQREFFRTSVGYFLTPLFPSTLRNNSTASWLL